MALQGDKAPRRRLRFTLRFLLLAVTLGCIVLAGWKPLRRHAYQDVQEHELETLQASMDACSSPFPLVVANAGIDVSGDPFGEWIRRRYYVWLFGYVIELPFEREIE